MRSDEQQRLNLQPNDGQLDITGRYGAPEAHTYNNQHFLGGMAPCHVGSSRFPFPGVQRASRRECLDDPEKMRGPLITEIPKGQKMRCVVLFFSILFVSKNWPWSYIICALRVGIYRFGPLRVRYAGRVGLGSYWVGSSSIYYYYYYYYYSTMRQNRY